MTKIRPTNFFMHPSEIDFLRRRSRGATTWFASSFGVEYPEAMAGQSTLLFDGDCGFCTWVINKVKRWLKPRAQVVPWQTADLDDLGVSELECVESIQFVNDDGTHVSEGRAVAQLLKVSRQPWSILGSVVELPLVINATNATYRLLARNRYRLPGSTPACQLEAPPVQKKTG